MVTHVVIACCVLHNICQISKDEYPDDDTVLRDILRQERQARQRRRQDHERNPDGVAVRQ